MQSVAQQLHVRPYCLCLQAMFQWLARQDSCRSQASADAGSAADGSSGPQSTTLQLPMTQKQYVMSHR